MKNCDTTRKPCDVS